MSVSIAFANQKGGVGKTTSVINVGAALAEQHKRVLLVDFDPQANLSSGLNITPQRGQTVYDLLTGAAPADRVLQRTSIGGLHVIPADIQLSGANVELVAREQREHYLDRQLVPLRSQYDYVLIDSPPSLEMLTINVLAAADVVVVPLQCEYFALEGLKELLRSIRAVRSAFNGKLSVLGIACTMYDSRTTLSREVVAEAVGYFKELVFQTVIPRNVRVAEAPSHGMSILQYDSHSVGAENYRMLSQEIIERVGR